MSYSRLLRFLVPLAVTSIVVELGSQVLNGGMARIPRATETLAAYGLAWALILFLSSPLGQVKELGLVLVSNRASLLSVRRFVLGMGLILMLALASLTLTPIGNWIIEGLHGIDDNLGRTVRVALFWLIPYPALRGMALLHAGLLLRVRRTEIVSYATVTNLCASILSVFLLISTPLIRTQPILLPVIVTYTGLLIEFAILLWGCGQHVFPTLHRESSDPHAEAILGLIQIIRFFWPLSLIMLIQEMSRPIINLFIARGPDPTLALAILAVVYTLGRIPYGWLNEIRNLASAFREEEDSRHYIRRFAVGCGLVSFAMMITLFWTPLRDYILSTLIGVTPQIASGARIPLFIYSFFSFIVTLRAYYHGIGLVERRTRALAPSAPARIAAIFLTCLLLPYFGIYGATMGLTALLAGFLVEATTVWWGVRGWSLLQRTFNSEGYAS